VHVCVYVSNVCIACTCLPRLVHVPFRSLKTAISLSLWISHTGSASDCCALQEVLYKCIDTIQYKYIIYLHVSMYCMCVCKNVCI